MITILHYIIRYDLIRVHLPFEYIKDINVINHYLIPSTVDKKLYKDIKNKTIVNFNDNNIINIINNIKPNLIIISDTVIDEKIFKKLSKYNIYLIRHGIYCDGILNKITGKAKKGFYIPYCSKIFFNTNETIAFTKNNNKHITGIDFLHKFIPINGYYGFDYLDHLSNTTKLNKNKIPHILFIVNKAGFNSKQGRDHNLTYNEYINIINSLINIKIPIKILVKMKHTGQIENKTRNIKQHQNTNIQIISSHDIIYPYLLMSDIILIQGYSSCFFEALYLNKPTIVCQIPKNMDFLGIDNYPIIGKELQVNNIKQLNNKILKLINNPVIDKYPEECQQILKDKIGGYPFETVYNKVLHTYKLDSQHHSAKS